MSVISQTFSTKSFGTLAPRPMDLDDEGSPFLGPIPCGGMVSGSAQVEVVSGTGSAFVLTVQVSNDPAAESFANHPSTVTLTNAAQITAAFSVVGYAWMRVKLTTVNSGDATGHVHVCLKDSPA